MVRKKALPTRELVLNTQDPITQTMVIDFCRQNGVPVYEGTTGFDPDYPILYWDTSADHISQRGSLTSLANSLSVEDFIKQFFSSIEPIKVGSYDVVVHSGDTVKVGCQTISFEEVEQVYLAMKECRE